MKVLMWFLPRILVSLITGSIISWALAAFLISQFQNVVDTLATSLTSRIESSDEKILALDDWSRDFTTIVQTQLQSVGLLDDRVGQMSDAQEAFFQDNRMRINALAESTDILISDASRMLKDYATPEPVPLGLVTVGSAVILKTNNNGLLAFYFEADRPIYPFLTLQMESLPPASVRVSMFSKDNVVDAFFVEVFSALTQPIAFGSAKVGLVPALKGTHYILIEGSPNIEISVDFFDVPEKN